MLPILHPIGKTSIELRRAINRLHVFMEQNPEDEHVKNGSVEQLLEDLKAARSHIKKDMRDPDLDKDDKNDHPIRA